MLIKSRRTELNNALISSVKSNRMILQIAKRQRHFNKYDFNKTLVGRKCRGKRRIDKKLVHGSCLFKGTVLKGKKMFNQISSCSNSE